MKSGSTEFLSYFAVSMVALAVDTLLLLLLAKVIDAIVAATISFVVGMMVCYALTVRYIFAVRRFKACKAKEATIFFLIGLVGLIVNDSVMYFAHQVFLIQLVFSKLSAAAVSFSFNFSGRKLLLFRARTATSEFSPQSLKI